MSDQPGPSTGGRRRILWAVAAVLVVLVAVALVRALTPSSGSQAEPTPSPSPSATAEATPSGSPTDPATPDATTAPETPPAEAPVEPAPPTVAGPGEPVPVPPVGDITPQQGSVDAPLEAAGLRVSVAGVTRVTAAGEGPGEFAGPGMAVSIEVTGGAEPVDLSAMVVNVYSGAAGVPVSSVETDPANTPVAGPLAAGATTRGTYVFVLPDDPGAPMAVVVEPGTGSPALVFQDVHVP